MKKILCVGDEAKLLSLRCEVLKRSGYCAQPAMVEHAAEIIRNEAFDLIIVSAFLSEASQQQVLSVAGEIPTLLLQGITVAPALLAAVKAKLSG